MNATLRRLRYEDDGFTLVELLVAMVITGMVLGLAGTFFANVARVTIASNTGRAALGQAELAQNAIRNAVTMASALGSGTPAVVAGSATSLTVISYSNTSAASVTPSQVRFTVDASGMLTESRTIGVLGSSGTWTFTGPVVTRPVAGPFTTGSGTPFFSYVGSSGAVIALTSGALAASDLNSVAFVRVTSHSNAKNTAGATTPVVLTTTIGLTNVSRDVDPSVSLPGLSGGQ